MLKLQQNCIIVIIFCVFLNFLNFLRCLKTYVVNDFLSSPRHYCAFLQQKSKFFWSCHTFRITFSCTLIGYFSFFCFMIGWLKYNQYKDKPVRHSATIMYFSCQRPFGSHPPQWQVTTVDQNGAILSSK